MNIQDSDLNLFRPVGSNHAMANHRIFGYFQFVSSDLLDRVQYQKIDEGET